MTEKLAALIEVNKKFKLLAEKRDGRAYDVVGCARVAGETDPILKAILDRYDEANAELNAFQESDEYKRAHS